jgi:hypothetical protein
VIGLVILGTLQRGGRPSAAPASSPATSAVVAPQRSAAITSAPAPPVTVTLVGHALLEVPANWDLFGLGPDGVVRIQLAAGRITRTAALPLGSGAPVSFLPARGALIIRSMDNVSGYLVPDGQPARPLSGVLGTALAVFPGPDPGHVWTQSGRNGPSTITLVDLAGRPTGVSVPLLADEASVTSDDAGGLILTDFGGAYAMRPDGLHRITPGALLAAGSTRWLATECDDHHGCSTVVIDRSSGARHVLGPATQAGQGLPEGAISPDGTTAALLRFNDDATPTFYLLDLSSGARRQIPTTPLNADQTFVWSPDSRWLFAVDAIGQINVIDRRSGQDRALAASLPQITQLTLRDTAP